MKRTEIVGVSVSSGSRGSQRPAQVQTGQHVPAGGAAAGEPGEGVLRGAVQLRGGSRVLRGHEENGLSPQITQKCPNVPLSPLTLCLFVCRSSSGQFTSVRFKLFNSIFI